WEDPGDGLLYTNYVDESGVTLSMSFGISHWNTSVILACKNAYIRRYSRDPDTLEGALNEPSATISYSCRVNVSTWGLSLGADWAPEFANSTFAYDRLVLSTDWYTPFDFLDGKMKLGYDISRTRGEKRRELQEVYRPLKIYIPGSGGGYNNLNFPVLG